MTRNKLAEDLYFHKGRGATGRVVDSEGEPVVLGKYHGVEEIGEGVYDAHLGASHDVIVDTGDEVYRSRLGVDSSRGKTVREVARKDDSIPIDEIYDSIFDSETLDDILVEVAEYENLNDLESKQGGTIVEETLDNAFEFIMFFEAVVDKYEEHVTYPDTSLEMDFEFAAEDLMLDTETIPEYETDDDDTRDRKPKVEVSDTGEGIRYRGELHAAFDVEIPIGEPPFDFVSKPDPEFVVELELPYDEARKAFEDWNMQNHIFAET
jgi:hypothetical protein